jgi:methylisocitrate lyase
MLRGNMPYIVEADLPREPAGQRFRQLLARPGILGMPGTHNGLAALQAKAAGFEAAYLSGAAMSASMGLPDLGIITVDEVCFFIRQVARSGLPVLVDGDTGYGEALNVMHMVRAFEEAGAAAVHIEDQLLPKKCGHLNDKKLANAHDMAAKVAAAAKAKRHLFLIARTDAAASEGMEGAVARAKLYLQAGADAIFPEALTSAEMFRAFAQAMPGVKLLANMTEFGRTPFFTASEFEAMGYRMVIWPASSLRVANKAQEELYAAIRRDGGTHKMVPRMQTRAELYATIGYHEYEALDASIVRTVLPNGPADRVE